MRTPAFLFLAFACSAPCVPAQVFTLTRDQLIRYTAGNPYDRFPDGRPKVPDPVLAKVQGLSLEEIWAVLPEKGFHNQYAGAGWQIMHPERKLVGRAVTVQFMPARPDISKPLDADAKAKGVADIPPHQRVIDMLQPDDVLVVDLFGLADGGTIVGDNLATAIWSATAFKGGLIVDGGIRDLEGIFPIQMPVYYRAAHPSFLDYQKVMLTGVNVPIKIGDATVMPGDVVFGDREGLFFIPPQYVKEILDRADETHIHDEWTKDKFMHHHYKSSDLYGSPRIPELKEEYEQYKKEQLGKEKQTNP